MTTRRLKIKLNMLKSDIEALSDYAHRDNDEQLTASEVDYFTNGLGMIKNEATQLIETMTKRKERG